MPVKNAGHFLKMCLDSILAQSFQDWELIAVDDHSTDNSAEILHNYSSDSRIRYHQSRGNGIVKALQTGYSQATGSIIHRMDADDIMPKNKLELLFKQLTSGSVITGRVKYFRDDKQVGDGFTKYENWLNNLWVSGNGWLDIFKECPIASPAWLMYRDDFDYIGGFDSDLMPEDYDLAFRMREHELNVVFVDEVVHFWRDSEARTSRNQSVYFPTAYFPLKVHYFLKIERNEGKQLVLWGAGKKGKQIAKLLLESGTLFKWVTNNPKKLNVPIYDVQLIHAASLDLKNTQHILATSGPDDQTQITAFFNKQNLKLGRDYFWFC